jgi:TonB-dependent starch-binding outer membrane protein SusC
MKSKLLLLLLLLLPAMLIAQERRVTGTVTDENGDPLTGVNVLIDGTSMGTVTDLEGSFTLNVTPTDQLRFSFIGYIARLVTVGNQTAMTITLEPDVIALSEVVVVGYGTSTKKELTGAVSTVDGDRVERQNLPRLDEALQGQIAGVNVTTNSGAPGGSANIRIRGLSTNLDNDPLILVDGVIYNSEGLNALSPADIESVTVLKDGMAGIYGVRAANGVILIETKKGKRNSAPSFSFSGYYGVQEAARQLDVLNAREYAILKNESFAAGGQTPPFNNVELGEGTDWQDEVFDTAPIQNYSLTVNGGSEKTTYSIGGSYFGQEGIVGGDKATFDRYNARINFTTDIAPKVNLTHVMLYTHEKSSGIAQGGIGAVLYNALNAYPTEPVRIDDRFSYLDLVADIINPVAQIQNTYNETRVNKLVGKEEITYEISDQFELTGRAGYNFALVDGKGFNPLVWYGAGKFANSADNENLDPIIVEIGDLEIERGANVTEYRNTFLDYNFEAFLNYNEIFNDVHSVKGTAGISYVGNYSEGLNGVGFNIPNNSLDLADISANQAPGGYLNNTGSFQNEQRLTSLFIRGEYGYDTRYLFSVILRRDGSSNFGPNNRIGYFPAVSGAWVMSEETFWGSNAINFLKFRLSYGVSGNDQIGLFRYRGQLNGEGNYVFNDLIVNGVAIGATSNPDLKWETTDQTNFGVDMSIGDHFDITANYFIKNTKDLLFQPEVSALLGSYGAGGIPPIINAGDVRNQGIELDLGYSVRSANDVSFTVNYNITYLKNEVTRVPDGFDFLPGANFGIGGGTATRFEKGFPIGYFIGHETNGIYQNAEEVASGNAQEGAQPGDLRFVDQNGDGVISFGNDVDRVMLGSPIPDVVMGLNFSLNVKGFDLSATVYAALGQEIIRNYERQQPFANQLAYNINRWTGEGTTNEYPRLTTGQTRNTIFSDFYVEDGSFVRLRNVQVGYTLPFAFTEKFSVKSLRIYVGANNLITLTNYLGYDPDVGSGNPLFSGVDNGVYPQARTIMAGINLNF